MKKKRTILDYIVCVWFVEDIGFVRQRFIRGIFCLSISRYIIIHRIVYTCVVFVVCGVCICMCERPCVSAAALSRQSVYA